MTRSQARRGWNLRVGGAIFLVSFASPFVVVPIVLASSLPTEWKSGLSGLFAVSVPEVGMLVAVAVMGKAGFEELKTRLLRPLGRFLPSDEVSPVRYGIGLALFSLPLLYGWLWPYVQAVFPIPNDWRVALLGDVVFVGSFFVLGGDFWDKIRALFVRDARVVSSGR